MPKTVYMAMMIAFFATHANAYSTTRCYWIGGTYTCTTSGSGGISTTRCYTIGNTVRCTSY